jgi:hypothetical protein
MPRGFGYEQTPNNELASQLQTSLEDFEDVPVISFGWVALFILVYILVVGPLDYFFLKKVVKRLELTWITFPTVVIAISGAAYFTAYWLKGNDLKINKIDLVDIDLQTQQVYGNTWFTIFSPRIQHYTIGLEPSESSWAPPGAKASSSTVLSWMSRPELAGNMGMGGRTQSQGLFRRAYDYATDATGLQGVPIQVWSTKSFAATWQAPLNADQPLIKADLSLTDKDKELIKGKITSQLPVPLEDVVLYSRRSDQGRWYSLGRLLPEDAKRVENVLTSNGIQTTDWIGESSSILPRQTYPTKGGRSSGRFHERSLSVMKQLLFHVSSDKGGMRNNSLRHLSQTWRLQHKKHEVILFGRIPREEGSAEDMTKQPGTPSQLWLGALPAAGQTRPPLAGTLAQETYVRVFIPVQSKE